MLKIMNNQEKAHQTHNEMSPHTSEWLLSKRQQITSVGEGVSVRAATREIVGRFLKKSKIELPYDPAIPLLDIDTQKSKNTNLKRYMHPNVHSSAIHNCQDMEAP